jgi:hypothetical protein
MFTPKNEPFKDEEDADPYSKKYYVNNQNDYSIDTYKSKYYINDSLNHQSGNDFSNHNLQSNTYKNLKSSQLASLYFSKYCKYKQKYINLKEKLKK